MGLRDADRDDTRRVHRRARLWMSASTEEWAHICPIGLPPNNRTAGTGVPRTCPESRSPAVTHGRELGSDQAQRQPRSISQADSGRGVQGAILGARCQIRRRTVAIRGGRSHDDPTARRTTLDSLVRSVEIYGSEGWGFESLRVRTASPQVTRRFHQERVPRRPFLRPSRGAILGARITQQCPRHQRGSRSLVALEGPYTSFVIATRQRTCDAAESVWPFPSEATRSGSAAKGLLRLLQSVGLSGRTWTRTTEG